MAANENTLAGQVVSKQESHVKELFVQIDKTRYPALTQQMTGRQLLALVDKAPETTLLQMRVKGKMVPVGADDIVDIADPGLERFVTVPKEVTEGDGRQRDFDLLSEDEEYLINLGLLFDTTTDGQSKRVVIRGYQVPDGYNHKTVDAFVFLPAGYPDAQIDMVYFYPELQRSDGRHIRNLLANAYEGKQWQGWSRHRTSNSAWRIGVDHLATHMALVDNFLREELAK